MRLLSPHKVCKDQQGNFHMSTNSSYGIQISCRDQPQYARQAYRISYIITREHQHIVLVINQFYPKGLSPPRLHQNQS